MENNLVANIGANLAVQVPFGRSGDERRLLLDYLRVVQVAAFHGSLQVAVDVSRI